MMIMDFLKNDPELVAWRKEYREMGLYMPGWHYDCFPDLEEYKEYIRKDLAKKKAERGLV